MVISHIIKTGGSTIAEHFARRLGSRFCNLGIRGIEPDDMVVMGHRAHYGIVPMAHYITFVRDPADWHLSVYHHHLARSGSGPSFEQWYESAAADLVCHVTGPRNRMSRWAARFIARSRSEDTDELIEVLDNYWMIGLTEELDDTLGYLCEILGIDKDWKRVRVAGEYDPVDGKVIPRIHELSDEWRERIWRENPEDVRLYEYAKERAWQPTRPTR